MKIYTRQGDNGLTQSFHGEQISKDSLIIQSVGFLDELNSTIGIARAFIKSKEIKDELKQIQQLLINTGSELATSKTFITSKDVTYLEHKIDQYSTHLTPLTKFLLPGDDKNSALVHHARAVCRRTERRIVKLNRQRNLEQILIFLNRLSDFLFILARFVEKNPNN